MRTTKLVCLTILMPMLLLSACAKEAERLYSGPALPPDQVASIKGTFHLDEGYYYFRNIDNRILFGGGRNLDFKGEETATLGETDLIQNQLETILKESILPNTSFEIERRWSGIMGMGNQKKPIVKQISDNVFCGVRLGGMGIAIGSLVGKELADLI